LSNLYKPWSIKSEAVDARVINSDAILEEFLQKNAQRSQSANPIDVETAIPEGDGETGEAEFKEGLAATGVYTEIEDGEGGEESWQPGEPETMETAQHMQQAQQTEHLSSEAADKLLAEAKEKADELLAQAKSSAEQIEEEARQRGRDEAVRQLEKQREEVRVELQQSYDEKVRSLEEEYTGKRDSMEHELVDVITEVFNRVFHIQYDNKKQILLYLIDNALSGTEGEKSFHIKVAEDNVLFLENHREDLLDKVGHDIELEILADGSMGENDCIIETDSGIFDCSLGAQLENLTKDLRSLCS
jgi:flagellar assembly protein FliH